MIAGLERAVQAGERSLGPAFFAHNKGEFWGLLETRPYMRARLGLAQLLLSTGRIEQAVGHLEALLELNPNDNQGVRDLLLGCYLTRGNLGGCTGPLARLSGDATAVFARGQTLERFLSGDLPGARRAVRKARRENRFVEQYLTFQRPLPTDMPDTYALGSDEEAIIWLAFLSGAWADHPLAASWLWKQLNLDFASPRLHPHRTVCFD